MLVECRVLICTSCTGGHVAGSHREASCSDSRGYGRDSDADHSRRVGASRSFVLLALEVILFKILTFRLQDFSYQDLDDRMDLVICNENAVVPKHATFRNLFMACQVALVWHSEHFCLGCKWFSQNFKYANVQGKHYDTLR